VTARIVLDAVVMFTALVLQLSFVNLLPLPGGGPDLVVLGLASLAFVQGELAGALLGFLSGLALDLVPPSDGPVGRWALVLCLVGYLAGRIGRWAASSCSRRSAHCWVTLVSRPAQWRPWHSPALDTMSSWPPSSPRSSWDWLGGPSPRPNACEHLKPRPTPGVRPRD
jgi:rod shape-determining protein MreD